MIAGADTVSSALASLFSCLLEHPEVYAKLQAEVDRFYPPGEDALSTKHHKEMLYLNAVMYVLWLLPSHSISFPLRYAVDKHRSSIMRCRAMNHV